MANPRPYSTSTAGEGRLIRAIPGVSVIDSERICHEPQGPDPGRLPRCAIRLPDLLAGPADRAAALARRRRREWRANATASVPGDGGQGIAEADRAKLFHTPSGSEMIPLPWLKSMLNKQTGKPFLDDLDRYGFVPDPSDPDGLPIGLTVTDSKAFKGIKMVGANCAACHVGEVRRNGKTAIILGRRTSSTSITSWSI